MTKLKTIKDGFLWGGSLSAVQVDGIGNIPRSKILQDMLFEKYPSKHWAGIGPNVTIDFTNRYKSDIKMYKEIGINSIRYGFQWSRLFPDGQTLNKEAVKYYHNVIDEFLKNGIDPMMQLFHFDTPLWVKNVGGWTNEIVTNRFARFAHFVFKEYGNKVKYFATFNEPAVMKGIFSTKDWYKDGKPSLHKVLRECIGLIKCNAASYQQFQKLKKNNALRSDCKLGVVLNYNKSYPISDKPTKADLEAVKYVDAFMNIFWSDSLVEGKINTTFLEGLKKNGVVFPITDKELSFISPTNLDFIGENYYLPWRCSAPKSQKPNFNNPEKTLFVVGQKPNARMNKFRGWEIFPLGLTETLLDLWNRYKKPIYIGENGMGVDNEDRFRNHDGIIDDEYRISFLKEHIEAMQVAINQGVDVFGFHAWSMTDLWSSYNAFKNRYGFIEVDLNNNLKRRFKKSAFWYKQFIKTGEIESGYEKCDALTKEAMDQSEQIQASQKDIGSQNYETLFKSKS